MTEPELVEAMTSYHELLIGMLGLYLSVTSGYLAVVYLIGQKLTSFQITVITVLFVFFALLSTWAGVGYAMRGFDYVEALRQLNPERFYYGHPAAAVVVFVVLIGGVFASLSFMWSIRNPKAG